MNVALHLGGLVLIGGAAALGVACVLIATRPVVGQALGPDVAALLIVSAGLLLLGAPAMYAVQAEATGALGLAAHALLVVGLLLLVIVSATPLLYPSAAVSTIEHPLVLGLGIALVLGLLLTGIVTLQAGVLPWQAAGLSSPLWPGSSSCSSSRSFCRRRPARPGPRSSVSSSHSDFAGIGLALWAARLGVRTRSEACEVRIGSDARTRVGSRRVSQGCHSSAWGRPSGSGRRTA